MRSPNKIYNEMLDTLTGYENTVGKHLVFIEKIQKEAYNQAIEDVIRANPCTICDSYMGIDNCGQEVGPYSAYIDEKKLNKLKK